MVRDRLVVLLPLLLAACGGESDPAAGEPALTRAEFVEVMVELRRAELDLGAGMEDDSITAARFDSIRDEVLSSRGLTAEDLHAFLDRHPVLEYQEALWDSISERLRRARNEEAEAEPAFPEPGRRGELEGPDRPKLEDERPHPVIRR